MLEHKEHMSGVKYDMEKFDGRINFDLWQVKVNIVTIQLGLHNNLEKKKINCVFNRHEQYWQLKENYPKGRACSACMKLVCWDIDYVANLSLFFSMRVILFEKNIIIFVSCLWPISCHSGEWIIVSGFTNLHIGTGLALM